MGAGLTLASSCGASSAPHSQSYPVLDGSAPPYDASVPPLDATTPPGTPPVIPVEEDAYTDWAHLPYIRIGARTYMRSTYDRAGGNEAADASHYLRENAPGDDVALDVTGKGVLSFFRQPLARQPVALRRRRCVPDCQRLGDGDAGLPSPDVDVPARGGVPIAARPHLRDDPGRRRVVGAMGFTQSLDDRAWPLALRHRVFRLLALRSGRAALQARDRVDDAATPSTRRGVAAGRSGHGHRADRHGCDQRVRNGRRPRDGSRDADRSARVPRHFACCA